MPVAIVHTGGSPSSRRSSSRPTASRRSSPPASTPCSPRPGAAGRRSSSTTDRPTGAGEIAEEYAARGPADPGRARPNGGLGSARNVGLRHARPAIPRLPRLRRRAPPDGTVGARRHPGGVRLRLRDRFDRCAGRTAAARATVDEPAAPPAADRSARSQTAPRSSATSSPGTRCSARSFWDAAGLAWPEGIRYEDQPTTTRAFLAGTFDVLDDVVYHWRIRDDGSSITQQRASVRDLVDRWETKRMSYAAVHSAGDADVEVVLRRPGAGRRPVALLPGDPRRLATSGGRCSATACGSSGASGRWCTAGCRPCTGSAAGWSSRTGARTPRR